MSIASDSSAPAAIRSRRDGSQEATANALLSACTVALTPTRSATLNDRLPDHLVRALRATHSRRPTVRDHVVVRPRSRVRRTPAARRIARARPDRLVRELAPLLAKAGVPSSSRRHATAADSLVAPWARLGENREAEKLLPVLARRASAPPRPDEVTTSTSSGRGRRGRAIRTIGFSSISPSR